MGIKEYNKLVRDKIPEIVQKEGHEAEYKVITGKELIFALVEKLKEETEELEEAINGESNIIEELADIEEVLGALIDRLSVRPRVTMERIKKANFKGHFRKGLFLEKIIKKDV